MTIDDLCRKHPILYHMTSPDAWPAIERRGLLSTKSLVDLFEVPEPRKTDILTKRRAASVSLFHPEEGTVVIRDQIPLSEKKLAMCLQDGLTPTEWLKMLNTKVFFWVAPQRLEDLRNAKAYRATRQLVIEVDTALFADAYHAHIIVADRNTGTTSPFAHSRGQQTFLPLSENGKRRVVELIVEGGVPDIARFVRRATQVGGGLPDTVVFEER